MLKRYYIFLCLLISSLSLLVIRSNNANAGANIGFMNYLPLVFNKYSTPPANMVLVPAGEFRMGCDSTIQPPYPGCNSDEVPLHSVYLDSFFIDKYETTNYMYRECVIAGVCGIPENWNEVPPYYYNPQYDNFPVGFQTWDWADTYCTWLGKRLPTEAEWEKAARGSQDTRRYTWGNTLPACYMANYDSACVQGFMPVGSYPYSQSPYGVMDMIGNAGEWVHDWYLDGYYYISPYMNPQGPVYGAYRILKGQGYVHQENGEPALNVRISERWGVNMVSMAVGVRCALSLTP